jgi:hypothetical protein
MIESALKGKRPDNPVRDIGFTLEVRDSTRRGDGQGAAPSR